MKLTNDKTLDKALRKIAATVRGLEGADGARARRNARRRFLGALRSFRTKVDERWPAIIERGGYVRLKTFEGRIDRLRGWCDVGADLAGWYASAGVPVRKVKGKNRQGREEEAFFVPGWAAAIGPDNPTRLRAAKRSHVEKRIALAEDALKD